MAAVVLGAIAANFCSVLAVNKMFSTSACCRMTPEMCTRGAVTVFVDLVAIFEGQSSLWQPRTKWASLEADDGELFMCMDC